MLLQILRRSPRDKSHQPVEEESFLGILVHPIASELYDNNTLIVLKLLLTKTIIVPTIECILPM